MKVDNVSAMFARTLGPELGPSMAAVFTNSSATGKQLQAFLGMAAGMQVQAGPQGAAPPARHPFSSTGISNEAFSRPVGTPGSPAGSMQDIKRLTSQLDQILGSLTANQPGNPIPTGSGQAAMVASAGGNIDSMMSQAEQLLSSDKQSDQIKGQMLMQKAMRLFEMISKMMEQQSQLASKAIQAIR
jgi:hypothetical protein